MESRKARQMNLFAEQEQRCQIEKDHAWAQENGEGGMNGEIRFSVNILPHVNRWWELGI